MHTTALRSSGSVHPGQGRVPAAAACKPISSNKSAVAAAGDGAAVDFDPAVGLPAGAFAGAALAAAGFAAADCPAGLSAADLAGSFAVAACPPGIFSGFWQPGHFT